MNAHILLVMKWLDNKNSVTQQELVDNRKSAYDAYVVAADAADAAYAAYAAAAADADAEKWVNKYFERTKENKQDYIDAINPMDDKPIYTQAMQVAGERPQEGCKVIVENKEYEFIKSVIRCNCRFALCVEYNNTSCFMFTFSELNPIDTRTDTEKAVEALSMHVGNCESDFGILQAIINGDIPNVEFTGRK